MSSATLRFPRLRFRNGMESAPSTYSRVLPPSGCANGGSRRLVETRGEPSPRALELANEGNTVLVLTPRGLPSPPTRNYSGDWLPNVRAFLLGRNLPAMRAHDILNGYQILKSRPNVDPAKISAEANGMAGVWLLMAAAVEPGIATVSLKQTPHSFAQAFESPLTRDLHSAVVPGFALHWDLAGLVAPERLLWNDPADWLGHVTPLKGRFAYTPATQ